MKFCLLVYILHTLTWWVDTSYAIHWVTILRCRRKHHLGVKYVITNLLRLDWQYLCETQDAKQANHRRGINRMMSNRRSTDKRINRPSQKESNYSIGELFSRMQLFRLHEAVMSRRVFFCVIICQIGYALLPVNEELAAAGAVADPVEVHVDGFGLPLSDGVI